MSNLQLRILSGVVLAAAVLGITIWGGLAARLLAALIALLMLQEWIAMDRRGIDRRLSILAWLLLTATLAAMVVEAGAAVAVALLVGAAFVLALTVRGIGRASSIALGFAYAGASGLALGFLRGDDNAGLLAILFLFAVVWATDILAYFVGKSIGGPKLAPAISPGKTWSGAVGGTVGGVVAGLLFGHFAGLPSLPVLGAVAFFLSVIAQVGDLFESAIKRRNGVKDSGNLIPGHGGVLDRVDGLVAAAIALYVIGWLLAGADNPAHSLFLA